MKSLAVLILSGFCVWACQKSPSISSPLKIVGGHDARYHPYFAQVMMNSTDSHGICGGVLIAPRVVLTAAHCLEATSIENLHVALGISQTGALQTTNPVRVEAALRHEKFTGDPADGNDIALLYLAEYQDTQFDRPVTPIAWEALMTAPLPKAVLAVGTGNQTSLGDVFSRAIKEVSLPVLPADQCESYTSVLQSQICAGNVARGGVDTCEGDTGGPILRVNSDNSYTLLAIVSFAEGCGQADRPALYTNLAYFSKWLVVNSALIQKNLGATEDSNEIKSAVATRCLGQIGHVVRGVETDGVERQTIWTIDPLGVTYNRSNITPSGQLVAHCSFLDDSGHDVKVTWYRSSADRPTFTARVELFSGASFVSTPWKSKYVQDRIYCNTARGAAGLYDQRRATYILVGEQFYLLGEPVSDPAHEVPTWGCRIEEVALEIFESPRPQKHLNARVTHKSIGTVTRSLIPASIDPASLLKVSLSQTTPSGRFLNLVVENIGSEDLFTWKLTCTEPFGLELSSQTRIDSSSEVFGSGYGVVVNHADFSDGMVRVNDTLSVKFDTKGFLGPWDCVLNNAFPVVVL